MSPVWGLIVAEATNNNYSIYCHYYYHYNGISCAITEPPHCGEQDWGAACNARLNLLLTALRKYSGLCEGALPLRGSFIPVLLEPDAGFRVWRQFIPLPLPGGPWCAMIPPPFHEGTSAKFSVSHAHLLTYYSGILRESSLGRISQIRTLRCGWCREPLSIRAHLGLRPCRPCAGWGDRAGENVVRSCSFFL